MKKLVALVMAVGLAVGLLAPPASARPLTADDLRVKVRMKTVAAAIGARTIAKATCPRDRYLFGGGAFFHRPGRSPAEDATGHQVFLAASFPKGARRWVAHGYNHAGPADLQMTVLARCTRQKVYTSKRSAWQGGVEAGSARTGLLSCASGSIPLMGGGYLSRTLDEPDPLVANVAHLSASYPGWNGMDNWLVVGANRTTSRLELHVVVYCTDRLAILRRTEQDFAFGGAVGAPTPAGSYSSPCFAPAILASGGAYVHNGDGVPGSALAARSWLSSQTPVVQNDGWYGTGGATEQAGDDLSLRLISTCLAATSA